MQYDYDIFLYLNTLFSGTFWTYFFKITTGFGNGLVQAILIIPLMYFFNKKSFKKHMIPLILTAAIGGLLVVGLKIAVNRQRPPAFFEGKVDIHTPTGDPVDKSFPSGHTQTAFSTATYLSLITPPLTPIYMILAALVAISRIALGVHFPLDVLVGAILGILTAFISFKTTNRFYKN